MTGAPPVLSLSDAERRRVEEVDRLTAAGAVGVPRLVDMLADRSWTVRRAVVAALAALGEPAVAALCTFIATRRGDEAALAAAVDALCASAAPADAAVAALVNPVPPTPPVAPAIAADVAQILGRRRSTAQLPTLIALAAHANDNVAVAALEALGRIGGRAAIETLIAAVASGNFFRTFPAIDVLGRSGDPRAVVCLAELLSNPRYRIEAARALGQSGDRGAVGPLAGLLGSADDGDVRLAALALSELRLRHQLRTGSTEAIDKALQALQRGAERRAAGRRLVEALAGGDAAERQAIATLLGALGDGAVAPTLIGLLAAVDEQPGLAQAAAAALHGLGAAAEESITAALATADGRLRAALLPLVHRAAASAEVLRCLDDADPEARAAACDALGRLGNPAVAPSLVALLDDRNPRVAQAAAGALQALGGTETLRLVTEAASSPSPVVRRSAMRILGYLGYDKALPVLLAGLGDGDARVRDAAIYGLAFFEQPAALAALLGALADPAGERVRAAAARALGQRAGEPAVVAALIAATGDADAWVRYYACQSLGTLHAATAADAIARRLDDPAGQVRMAAIEALAHFPGPAAHSALEQAARSDDLDTRRAALIGLGLGGRRQALPILIDATRASDAATRLVAFSAIASLDERWRPSAGGEPPVEQAEVVAALVAGTDDAEQNVRRAALRCLGARGGATAALLTLLRRTPDDPALQAALSVPSPARIAELHQALRGADDELAPHLAWALARMREPPATAALIDTLAGSGSPAARKAAAPALAMLTSDSDAARWALRQAAARDPDPEVRRVSALLLGP